MQDLPERHGFVDGGVEPEEDEVAVGGHEVAPHLVLGAFRPREVKARRSGGIGEDEGDVEASAGTVQVVEVAEVLLSSRKELGSSLRKTKGSRITHLGRASSVEQAMVDLSDLWRCRRRRRRADWVQDAVQGFSKQMSFVILFYIIYV